MTIFVVRAVMVDGSIADLLQFIDESDANWHAAYVRRACGLLGYDTISVVPRRVIGSTESLERRMWLERRSHAE